MNTLYIPRIFGNMYGGQDDEVSQDAPNEAEMELFELMTLHPDQGRPQLIWSPKLARIAHERGLEMALEGWTGHVGPDGIGPNWKVFNGGYRLPHYYLYDGEGDKRLAANNVEAGYWGGPGTVARCWQRWLESPPHREHVLALNDFWAGQTQIGLAFVDVPGSEFRFYWIALSAPPEGS